MIFEYSIFFRYPYSEPSDSDTNNWPRNLRSFGQLSVNLELARKNLVPSKIECFNFKPQYLLNYSSPTNDLYSVRKRSIGAFKSMFKLLGWGPASAGPLRETFFERSSPLACGSAALAPNFAPKLCTRRVSACFSACFKTCWGRFDPMLIPLG